MNRLAPVAMLIVGVAACSPYQAADTTKPPGQSAYAANVDCFRESARTGMGGMFGAVGGVAEGIAWANNGGPERMDACMRDRGFIKLR